VIRRLAIAALALAAAAFAAPASAQDLTIKPFFGSFAGSGVAKSEDSLYFGVSVRDVDVEIRPTADGFRIAWTTVLRQGGDPNKPIVKKNASAAEFVATAKANFFAGKANGDPLQGKSVVWATIKRNTLTAHFVSVDEDGRPEVQSYSRTLTGEGMDLVYSRVVGDEKMRTVKAKLTRQSN
jgi:hypothetical protein